VEALQLQSHSAQMLELKILLVQMLVEEASLHQSQQALVPLQDRLHLVLELGAALVQVQVVCQTSTQGLVNQVKVLDQAL